MTSYSLLTLLLFHKSVEHKSVSRAAVESRKAHHEVLPFNTSAVLIFKAPLLYTSLHEKLLFLRATILLSFLSEVVVSERKVAGIWFSKYSFLLSGWSRIKSCVVSSCSRIAIGLSVNRDSLFTSSGVWIQILGIMNSCCPPDETSVCLGFRLLINLWTLAFGLDSLFWSLFVRKLPRFGSICLCRVFAPNTILMRLCVSFSFLKTFGNVKDLVLRKFPTFWSTEEHLSKLRNTWGMLSVDLPVCCSTEISFRYIQLSFLSRGCCPSLAICMLTNISLWNRPQS